MPSREIVMKIKKPHFTVKLHEELIELDLNEGFKKELEDVLEAKPALRGSLGFLFQTVIPLDVPLKDVDSVKADKKGKVKIKIPHRRDIVIPLAPEESRLLVGKMREFIDKAKEKALTERLESEKARKELEPKKARAEEEELRERLHRA